MYRTYGSRIVLYYLLKGLKTRPYNIARAFGFVNQICYSLAPNQLINESTDQPVSSSPAGACPFLLCDRYRYPVKESPGSLHPRE